MKLRIPVRGLERALSVVARAAAQGNPRAPVLWAALFEAEGGSLRISATDGELGSSLRCSTRVEKEGRLAGALLSVEEGAVRMVATDSYRMAVTTSELREAPEDGKRAIVPARCLAEAVRIAALCEKLTVAITENAAYFKGAGITLKGRLIEGDYPDHTKLLPGSFAREFSVEARTLSATLKRVNLFAARQSPPAPVRLAFSTGVGSLEGGVLTVSSACAEAGAATEKIGVTVEEAFEAAFNGAYLLDGLRACGGERLRLRFNEPLKPAVISPEGVDAEELAYLVMPVRDPHAAGEAPAAEGR